MPAIRRALLAPSLLFAVAASSFVATALAAPAWAHDHDGVAVTHAWARPSAGASTTGAAYVTLTAGTRPDKLTGVSSPAAAKTELHETIDDKGVMRMRAVSALDLGVDKPVEMKPGGYHIMLTGLKQPLKAGESFPLTLTFEHAAPVTTQVTVQPMAGGQAAMGGHDMGGMPGHTH